MSDLPPRGPEADRMPGLNVVQPVAPGGGGRVEDMTLRLLRDMRAEHAASMEAMRTALAANGKVFANMERMFDRLDALQADLTAFRAETERNFRRLEGDMIAAEGRIISRQMEIAEAVNRIGKSNSPCQSRDANASRSRLCRFGGRGKPGVRGRWWVDP